MSCFLRNELLEYDTFLVKYNPYYSNIWIKLFEKKNGIFEEVDFFERFNVSGLNGRIPVTLNKEIGPFFRESYFKQLGNITYNMYSMWTKMNMDTIKIGVQIVDRALHESNIVYSDDIIIPKEP